MLFFPMYHDSEGVCEQSKIRIKNNAHRESSTTHDPKSENVKNVMDKTTCYVFAAPPPAAAFLSVYAFRRL